MAECERCARLYIERDDFEIEISKVAQITHYFRAFKAMMAQKSEAYQREINFLTSQVQQLKGDVPRFQHSVPHLPVPLTSSSALTAKPTVRASAESEDLVITVDLEDRIAQLLSKKRAELTKP